MESNEEKLINASLLIFCAVACYAFYIAICSSMIMWIWNSLLPTLVTGTSQIVFYQAVSIAIALDFIGSFFKSSK